MRAFMVLVAVAAAILVLVAGTASAIGPRRLASPTPFDPSGGMSWGENPDMGPRRIAGSGFEVGVEIGPRR